MRFPKNTLALRFFGFAIEHPRLTSHEARGVGASRHVLGDNGARRQHHSNHSKATGIIDSMPRVLFLLSLRPTLRDSDVPALAWNDYGAAVPIV